MAELKDVKGIGPKSLSLLNKINILTIEDLVTHYPFRYDVLQRDDLTKVEDGEKIIIDGKVESVPILMRFKAGLNKMNFRLVTQSGIVGVSIFNRAFLKSKLLVGTDVIVIGKLDKTKPFLNRKNVVNRTKQICDELYTEMIKSAVDELYSSSLNKSELDDLHKCIISDLANLCDSVRMHYDIQWDESLNKINITDNAIKHRLLLDKYNDLGDYILNNDVLRDKFNIAELVRNTLQKRIDEFLALEGVNYNGITYIGIEYIDMVFFPVLFENRMSIPNNVIPFTKYIMCDECHVTIITMVNLCRRPSCKSISCFYR